MKGAAEHQGRGNQPESAALLRALGADLSPELLERALTHRSFAYENGGLPTNERLEFLGDAVLGLVVTDALFRGYPDLPEGHLAKLRAAVVNMRALAEVARGLHLGDYVRLGRGEEGTGGRDKSSILADTLEAVIGAVYIERGLDEAGALVHRLFDPVIAQSARLGAGLDWKTSLQELTAAGVLGVPEYHVDESGPDHQKSFRALVRVGGRVYGSGQGRSKKEAEQQAAEAAWSAISTGTDGQAGEAGPEGNGGGRRRSGRGWAGGGRPGSHRARGNGAGSGAGGQGRDIRAAERRRAGQHGGPRRRRPRIPLVPELPEVEVVRRGLELHVVGRTIGSVQVLHPRAVRRHAAGPDDFSAAARGLTVTGARRRGKYLWLPVAVGTPGAPSVAEDALLAHLGMSGQLLLGRSGPARFAPRPGPFHLHRLRARSEVHRPADVRPYRVRAGRGGPAADDRPHRPRPDGGRASTRTAVTRRLRSRRTGIKTALLDQSLVSGIGNIYADEALWRARLHWATPAAELSRADVGRLLAAVRGGSGRGAAGRRHLVRQPVRERQRGKRVLRPVTRCLRARG